MLFYCFRIVQAISEVMYGFFHTLGKLGLFIAVIVGCFLLGVVILVGILYFKAQPYSIIRLLFP